MRRLEAGWLHAAPVRAVMDAMQGEAFFVGGAVRNTLMGEPVGDIDLATPLLPAEVIARAEAAGLRAVPTGIDHGTVTLVARGSGIEVTTFRADIATDGRHATVRFTTDIAEDAGRRDFTMNAVYADAGGEIIDPLDGLPDIAARRVRFIGDPHDRIREDYLRILRFFRFIAWYGNGADIDSWGLAAAKELASGMADLARERIGAEMLKLLAAPDPVAALDAMAACDVLEQCLPGADPAYLGGFVACERKAGAPPDPLARLAMLGGEDPATALRLSGAQARTLSAIRDLATEPRPPAIAAYLHDARTARAAALIDAATNGKQLPGDIDEQIVRGATARLPVAARDFIAAGLAPGPALGEALKRAEGRWIDSGFQLDKAALLGEGPDKGQ